MAIAPKIATEDDFLCEAYEAPTFATRCDKVGVYRCSVAGCGYYCRDHYDGRGGMCNPMKHA